MQEQILIITVFLKVFTAAKDICRAVCFLSLP